MLRLTSSPIPDTEQLIRQADMISALTAHRDLLLHQAEEQHLRWHSERDDWNRMAETLLLQQAKNRMTADLDDVSHHPWLSLDFYPLLLTRRCYVGGCVASSIGEKICTVILLFLQETERINNALDSENKSLRQRVRIF